MYSQQVRRKESIVFMQMHSMDGNKHFTKLAGSLVTSMQSLQQKKIQIMNITDTSKLPSLFLDFQKQHQNFLNLQKNFFSLDQVNNETQRLKERIKDFLNKIKIDEIEAKVSDLRRDKVKQKQRLQIKRKVEVAGGMKTVLDNRQQVYERLLQEQDQELKMMEKIIADIKSIAIKTSQLIYEQGQNLNIAASNMKSVKTKLEGARAQLVQANRYEQNTNRKKMFICLLLVIVVIIILMIIIASKK